MTIEALQDYVFSSRYARYVKEKKRRETWPEAVNRVKEMHLKKYPNVSEEINWAFDRVLEKKALGSQRALQFGGDPIEKNNAKLYNCAFSYCDRIRFFQESLFLLLAGCGVGFSVQKHHVAKLPPLRRPLDSVAVYTIPDSIEGWAEALGTLLESYFYENSSYYGTRVKFDYSKIREKGSFISSGIGKAPGPEPLRKSLEMIRKLLDRCLDNGQVRLRPIDAYDIVMHAADAVLSGGVRRSATLSLFSSDDEEMATAKTGTWFYDNPQRARSNNSALLIRDKTTLEQFSDLMKHVKEYGEPGFVWADDEESGFNPCVEINFHAYDEFGNSGFHFCNLSEINGKMVKSIHDFKVAAQAAAIIGTLQAGYNSFPYLGEVTERIVRREALLGVSITGIMENPDILLNPAYQREVAEYVKQVNAEISEKIGINPAARCTCVKPAGCQKEDTLIVTDRGILTLGEIGNTRGDTWQNHTLRVYSEKGYKNSTQFFVNGLAKTKKIRLRSGVVLESTFNHKYKVFRDGTLDWVRADEIVVGDTLPYVVGGYESTNDVYLEPLAGLHFNSRWKTSPDKLNYDLCWFLGLYTGDGSNHKKGIRIHGNKNDASDLYRAKIILMEQFQLESTIESDRRDEDRLTLVVNSVDLLRWLELNGLKKAKSASVNIPLKIRTARRELIAFFINGYWCADGYLHPVNKTRNWVTVSRTMAEQLLAVLRAIGQDCSMREMPTSTSKGERMRYWIQERKGRNGKIEKSPSRKLYKQLDEAGLSHLTPDTVISIEESECQTFDIEVPDGHDYCANSYISHNTTSAMLGTSSGIHPHHSKIYFRRVQGNNMETPLVFFSDVNPLAVEKSVWSETDAVLTFCIEASENATTKQEMGALQLLECVKRTQQNWVEYGTRVDRCAKPWLRHNVSNTINVRPHEWEDVTHYIYKNREYFAGIALLSHKGDLDFPQAPFCAVSTPAEIVTKYGNGSLMASGLIVDGLHAYKDLWKACDAVQGRLSPANSDQEDWVRRARQFASRYFGGDETKMLYCLKEVNLWKHYCDLKREWRDVDYSLLREATDETDMMIEPACAGGACAI